MSRHTRQRLQPPIRILIHHALYRALIRLIKRLRLQSIARRPKTPIVHRMLQPISFPPKHVIAMLPIPRRVPIAQHKRLASIRRPVRLVIELARVPYNLIMHLRDLDRVARRALGAHDSELRRPRDRMGDMFRMRRRIEVLAVPADRKDDARPDSARARLLGERLGVALRVLARGVRVAAKVGARVAPEARLHVLAKAGGGAAAGVARKHAEAGLEGRHGLGTGRRVVDGDAGVGGADLAVDHLRDALVGAVAGAEVDVGGPVVGEVLGKTAGGAGGEFGDVGVGAGGHGGVEGVLGGLLLVWSLKGGMTGKGEEIDVRRRRLDGRVKMGACPVRQVCGGVSAFVCDQTCRLEIELTDQYGR